MRGHTWHEQRRDRNRTQSNNDAGTRRKWLSPVSPDASNPIQQHFTRVRCISYNKGGYRHPCFISYEEWQVRENTKPHIMKPAARVLPPDSSTRRAGARDQGCKVEELEDLATLKKMKHSK